MRNYQNGYIREKLYFKINNARRHNIIHQFMLHPASRKISAYFSPTESAIQPMRIEKLCAEIEEVMAHTKHLNSFSNLTNEIFRVAEATRENISSMRQDVMKRRKTELDYLNGYLCHQAFILNIEIPENLKLLAEIKNRLKQN